MRNSGKHTWPAARPEARVERNWQYIHRQPASAFFSHWGDFPYGTSGTFLRDPGETGEENSVKR